MKYIEMKTPNGKYKLPLIIVACNRTNSYSEQGEGFEINSKKWKEEMSYIMNDGDEGIDWMMNNMNLDDVKPFMQKMEEILEEEDDWFYDSDNFDSFED